MQKIEEKVDSLLLNRLITHINFAKGFRGGERQSLNLIKELSKRGYSQRVITRKNSLLAEKLEGVKNLEIIQINKPYIFNLKKVKGSSILHAHEAKAVQFSYFAKLLYKIPYIVTRRVDKSIKNNFFNKSIYLNAKKVVVLSNAIKRCVFNLSSSVDTQIIADAKTEYEVDDNRVEALKQRFKGKFIVGNIAALEESKGQQFIISLAKKIIREYPDIHFILLGNGKDELKFKELSKGLDNITFEGFVDNVGDYLCIFNIFVFPTLNEGFGSSILDAMNFSIPVVAFDVGGVGDIINDQENGILVKLKDETALNNQILKLYNDRVLLKNLASNNNLDQYEISYITSQYEKLYVNPDYAIDFY
jgi:glycosyltransferase involved in cell wall biosynthesis